MKDTHVLKVVEIFSLTGKTLFVCEGTDIDVPKFPITVMLTDHGAEIGQVELIVQNIPKRVQPSDKALIVLESPNKLEELKFEAEGHHYELHFKE